MLTRVVQWYSLMLVALILCHRQDAAWWRMALMVFGSLSIVVGVGLGVLISLMIGIGVLWHG